MSVVSRILFSEAIAGDFEIMQVLAAMAVFSFLPLLMLQQGNVAVSIVTNKLPANYRIALDRTALGLLAIVLALLTFYGALGAYDAMIYQEQSQILRLPIWVVMAYGCICMAISCLACLTNLIGGNNNNG